MLQHHPADAAIAAEQEPAASERGAGDIPVEHEQTAYELRTSRLARLIAFGVSGAEEPPAPPELVALKLTTRSVVIAKAEVARAEGEHEAALDRLREAIKARTCAIYARDMAWARFIARPKS